MYKPLHFYSDYVTEKVKANNATYENYIAVDNMLPNKGGITKSQYLPKQGSLTKFVKNDILIGNIRPYFKKIWIATFDGFASQDVLVLRNNDKISTNFLYFALSQNDFFDYVMKGSKGSKMPRGDKNHILNYPILCVKDEKIIGKFLSNIDEKIENNNKISAKLEQMAKLIYDYYFVQFDYPDKNGKPYKSSGGTMKYNEILKREIPANWEVLNAKERLNFQKGIEPGSNEYQIKNNDNVKFYKVGDMLNDAEIYVDKKFKVSAYAQEKDLLVSFDGSVGRIAIGINGVYSSGIQKISDKQNKISIAILWLLFSSVEFQKTIKNYATGSNILHASPSIKYLNFAFNENIFEKFNKIVEPIFNQIIEFKKENQKLANLRDFLLPMLMNGQVGFKGN